MIRPQLLTKTRSPSSNKLDEPVVLCAADDNYVRPLAVTLHSAASHLRSGNHLHVLLIDGGITEANWIGLKETLVGLPISIHLITPDRNEVSDLGISHHITHTAYFRLLAARLVPRTVEKVIYLDSDVLVQDDLSELWRLDVEPHYCLAAIDIACPYIDAYSALRHNRRAIPYLASPHPIPNWRELHLDGSQPYFNSGVMVLNLRRWRDEQVERSLLQCLRDHAKHVWCWDQYALNVVFAKQWAALPARWNQGAHLFEYPDEWHSPIDSADFREMRDNPALIHFTTEFKPWSYKPYHPLRARWYAGLDETAFAAWRPAKPRFSLRDWWTSHAVHCVRQATIQYRKLRVWRMKS